MFKTGHNYRQGQTPYRSAAQTGCNVNWPVEAGAAHSAPLHRLIAQRIAVRKFYLPVAGCFENYPARSFGARWLCDVHTFYLAEEGPELRYGHFRPAGSLNIGRHYGQVFNFSVGFSSFYWARNYYFPWVSWNWVINLQFVHLQKAGERNFFHPVSCNPWEVIISGPVLWHYCKIYYLTLRHACIFAR